MLFSPWKPTVICRHTTCVVAVCKLCLFLTSDCVSVKFHCIYLLLGTPVAVRLALVSYAINYYAWNYNYLTFELWGVTVLLSYWQTYETVFLYWQVDEAAETSHYSLKSCLVKSSRVGNLRNCNPYWHKGQSTGTICQ